MPATQQVNDLLALATLRRLLLELGAPPGPEVDGTLVGSLEQWMRQPCKDLGNDSPISVLAREGGVDRVRQSLRGLISQKGPLPP